MNKYFLFIALSAGPVLAAPKLTDVMIMARVADRSVSDRMVKVEMVLENPKIWRGPETIFGKTELNQALQRVLVQEMVREDNRIFRSESVQNDEVNRERLRIERVLGTAAFKSFEETFDLSRAELNDRIYARLLVEKSLNMRIRAMGARASGSDQQTILEDWIGQLRNRYKVTVFRDPQQQALTLQHTRGKQER